MPKNIIIFASGRGSNAENLMRYFNGHLKARIRMVVTNKAEAEVVKKAEKFGVPVLVLDKNDFYQSDKYVQLFKLLPADLIVLAGFLWMVPENLIKAFPDRIINLHPSLLPKYGGKGMYGDHVHKAVMESKETQSGITIHYVNEEYDKGAIIHQAQCDILPEDTIEQLKEKIHCLEQEHLPLAVEKILSPSNNQ